MLDITYLIIFTAIVELITIVVRYVFKISAKISYEKILRRLGFRRMIHIHHMYFGVIISIYSYLNALPIWFNLGLALIISDLLHHFLFLKAIEGDTEFRFIHRI